jgi:hypothetical protein
LARFTHQGIRTFPYGLAYSERKNFIDVFDKTKIERTLEPVIEFHKRYDVPVLVGEFSAIRWAPGRDLYLRDAVDIFEENGLSWIFQGADVWRGWDINYEPRPGALGKRPTESDLVYVGAKSDTWKLLVPYLERNKRDYR